MPPRDKAENYTLVFGSNILISPEEVISVVLQQGNVEIVKVWSGTDGKLLVEAKIKNDRGQTICKIGNSKVQYLDEKAGLIEKENGPDGILILRTDGKVIFECRPLEEHRTIKINGLFHVSGWCIDATDERIILDGPGGRGNVLSKNTISGCAKAFVLTPDGFGIGG